MPSTRERERRDPAVHRRRARRACSASGKPSRKRCPSARSCARIASQPSSRRTRPRRRSPASSSCASVPVSKRLPTGSSAAGRTLYGRHDRSELLAAEGEAEVRAEELVRRAEEDVDAELGDVDRPVRREVHGVRPRERARLVRELDDPPRVRRSSRRRSRRAGRRRRGCARSASARGRRGRASCRRAISTKPTLQVEVVRELEPRRDVAVVVEPRDEDLVAGARASGRACA